MADDMARQPEMWITQGPPGDQPPGGPTGPAPRGPGHGWGRWIAIVAGLAVLIGIIAAQHLLSGPTGRGGQQSVEPSAAVSLTPPPTTSRSETADTATSMTESSGDPRSSETRAASRTSTADGGPYVVTAEPSSPDPAPTTSGGTPADLDAAPFDLVALLWNGALSSTAEIVDYRSDTGTTVSTKVPALMSNGPMSFVVTTMATIVRPWDGVPGYVVPNGTSARFADGLLAPGGPVFPSDEAGRVWAVSPQSLSADTTVTLELVDADGHPTGAILKPPPSLGISGGWGLRPDGVGGVLADAVGGVYDLRPGETRRVTHGRVLAAGPTGYVVYECNDSGECTAAVLDRSSGKRTPLPGFISPASAGAGQLSGVISSNGRYAAMLYQNPGGPPLSVIDLHTGRETPVRLPIDDQYAVGASSTLAFTPDSEVLAVRSGEYVRWVNPATGDVLGEIHLGPIAAIAIRPTS